MFEVTPFSQLSQEQLKNGSPLWQFRWVGLLRTVLCVPVLLGGILLALISLLLPASLSDPDIWWHLRNVQLQLATHGLLTHDTYSFTVRGQGWINYEWIAELPFYAGFRLGGEAALQVITFLALATIFIGIYWLACRMSRNPVAAFLVSIISVLLGTVSFGPRTLLFGWIFLVAELLLLDLFASGSPAAQKHSLWALPLLFCVWINTHGSWLIGFAVLAVFTLSGCLRCDTETIFNPLWTMAERRALFLNMVTSFAALFCNPYGWLLVFYPFDLAFRQKLNIASVEEWRTLDFHSPRGRLFIVVLSLLFIFQLLRRRRWTLYEIALLGIGVYAALTYSRFLFLAAILVMPIIAKDLALWVPVWRLPNRPLLNGGILVALLLAMLPWHEGESIAHGIDTYPVKALAYLKTVDPVGNIFNDYLWGGYLIWNTHLPVFIDSRVDIYERSGVFKDYLDATRLHDSLNILDKYKIRYVLMPKDAPLIYLLKNTHDWTLLYEDETASFLAHVPGTSMVLRAPGHD